MSEVAAATPAYRVQRLLEGVAELLMFVRGERTRNVLGPK
jgi:hypothetical protein